MQFFYSTGSGRTGAYITLDKALERYDKHGVVDILNTIIALRGHRPYMVSDPILLETIYNIFYQRILCGQSFIPLSVVHCATRQASKMFAMDDTFTQEYKVRVYLLYFIYILYYIYYICRL